MLPSFPLNGRKVKRVKSNQINVEMIENSHSNKKKL